MCIWWGVLCANFRYLPSVVKWHPLVGGLARGPDGLGNPTLKGLPPKAVDDSQQYLHAQLAGSATKKSPLPRSHPDLCMGLGGGALGTFLSLVTCLRFLSALFPCRRKYFHSEEMALPSCLYCSGQLNTQPPPVHDWKTLGLQVFKLSVSDSQS